MINGNYGERHSKKTQIITVKSVSTFEQHENKTNGNVFLTVHHAASCVSTATTNSYRECRYRRLHVYNYVLLKMSTWCSKH